ncbi:MAG: hypothetical protein WEB03_10745 [Nitriliruptor sp.]|uniref:hypothetical protein n=1 Tax=Nitriliruptor sp. TaxID=2448056 RepID=UPI0034A05168
MAPHTSRAQTLERVRGLPDRALDAVGEFLDAMTDLDVTLTSGARRELPGLPAVGGDELRAATLRNEARVWAAREQLYTTGLSREQAARRAGVKPNQITNLLRDSDLLALDGPEGLRLPAWQFDPEARRGRLEGIARVAAVFPGRALSLSSWVVAPNAGLVGRTPRQALLDGDVEQVVAVAAHHGA